MVPAAALVGTVFTKPVLLVEELAEVMLAYEYMERLCKQKGLSHKTASECRRHIYTHLMTRGDRVRKLADMLIGYFNREES